MKKIVKKEKQEGPNEENINKLKNDTPQLKWMIGSTFLFAAALSVFLRKNEGVVIDVKNTMKLAAPESDQVIVWNDGKSIGFKDFKVDDVFDFEGPAYKKAKQGQLVWVHTEEPPKFKDLTKEEQNKLIQAQLNGKQIQVWNTDSGWCDRKCRRDMKFFPIDSYKIKPEVDNARVSKKTV